MSFRHVHDVLESELPKHLKLTAVVLAEFADLDTGECWPSIETIARRCSSDRRTVQRNIRELEKLGAVAVVQKHRSGTWLYRVSAEYFEGAAKCHPQAEGGGAHATPGGGTDVTGGAAPTPPKPSVNHQQNRQLLRFPEFWEAYPLKRNKNGAKRAWRKGRCDAMADRLIADVKNRAQNDRQWVEGFAPHAATYLNNQRWEDSIERVKSAPQIPTDDESLLALCREHGIYTTGKSRWALRNELEGKLK